VLLITVAALVLCGTVWVAALIRLATPPRRAAPELQPNVAPVREEDRVRPVVDANGERAWVDADDLFWHEIVSWPPRKSVAPTETRAQHRRL
jgi:hypothetical protein